MSSSEILTYFVLLRKGRRSRICFIATLSFFLLNYYDNIKESFEEKKITVRHKMTMNRAILTFANFNTIQNIEL